MFVKRVYVRRHLHVFFKCSPEHCSSLIFSYGPRDDVYVWKHMQYVYMHTAIGVV